jgi:hypothetical protein
MADSIIYAIGQEDDLMKEEQQVQRIKKQILDLGPMLPGSLSEQWNVCGTLGCKCKDPQKPIRHGPYYQLSFSVKGRSSTLFIRTEEVPEARRRIQRYQRFKELAMALTQAYVDLARKQKLSRRLEA